MMSEHPFSNKLNEIADSMGIAMYQRLSLNDGALFLRCSPKKLQQIMADNQIRYLNLPDGNQEFFGYQLLEYLLGCVSGGDIPSPAQNHPDKIIRTKQVLEITGLSRSTLWRLEKKGDFPSRVPLSAGSVGWRLSQVQKWIDERQ